MKATMTLIISSVKLNGLTPTLKKVPALFLYYLKNIRHYRRLYRELEADGFDKAYGTDTTKIVEGFHMGVKGKEGEIIYRYQTNTEKSIKEILESLPLIDLRNYVFVDIGSGKGKVLLIAADFQFKRIEGVDISSQCTVIAQENIQKYRKGRHENRIKVHCVDVEDYPFPKDNLVLYLFNPFGESVMGRFLEKIKSSLQNHPREIYIIYYNPLFESLIEDSNLFRKLPFSVPHCSLYFTKAI